MIDTKIVSAALTRAPEMARAMAFGSSLKAVVRGAPALGLLAAALLGGQARAQNVNRMWANNCASCHGQGAEGGSAPSLLTAVWADEVTKAGASDKAMFDAVRDGTGAAEGVEGHAFHGTLTDAQCWAMVNFVHELRERSRRERVPPPGAENGKAYGAGSGSYTTETVISEGLEIPWGIDWLPDGTMLITERPGRLRTWDGQKLSKPVGGIPEVRHRGQGGLMDVAVDPYDPEGGWVYMSFSERLSKGGQDLGMTSIVRGHIKNGQWVDQQSLFRAKDEWFQGTDLHFGSRIEFDGHGHVFFGIGERGHGPLAQDLTRPNGKIHRLMTDGSVPKDNPFVGKSGAVPSIWSFGHRNPQGLVMDLEGRLWDTEHGPRGGDELNRIERGANYGWPIVSYGMNYNGTALETPWPDKDAGITMPTYHWLPSIATCGLDVVKGNAFPGWKNDLVAGGLAGNVVDRIRVDDDGKVVEVEELVRGRGRVRDVEVGPEGAIYIVLNQPDSVIRIVPATDD